MRCKSCNNPLSEFELRLTQSNGKPEDMCVECKIYIRERMDQIHLGNFNYNYLHSDIIDYDELEWPDDDDDEDF